MRENDNHPLTNGTYDWGDGWVEPPVRDETTLAEAQEALAGLLAGDPYAPWLTHEEACVALIQEIRELAGC